MALSSDYRRREQDVTQVPVVVRDPAAVWRVSPRAAVARDPTRKLSYISCVSTYDSIKMGLRFPFESLPEREAMVLLDVDPEVQAFWSQPETFRWSENRRARSYTPDILVAFGDGRREYRGVKALKAVSSDPDLAGRRDRIESECMLRGAVFRPWADREIRAGNRLSNAKRIVAGHAFLADDAAVESVLALERAIGTERLPTTVGALIAAAGGGRQIEGYLLGLVAIGRLSLDIERRIDDSTVLHAGAGNPAR